MTRRRSLDELLAEHEVNFLVECRLALKAISDEDPEGLLRMGAPEDEYSPEAWEVATRLSSGEIVDVVALRDIWEHYFGPRKYHRHGMSVEMATRIVERWKK